MALGFLPPPVCRPRSTVERRWWVGTARSPPVCAGPSSSGTAFISTARDGVTPTSRTGCENVSGSYASGLPPPAPVRAPPCRAGDYGPPRAAEGPRPRAANRKEVPALPRAPRAAPGPEPCDIPPFWRRDFPILFSPLRPCKLHSSWYFDLGRVYLLQGGVLGLFFCVHLLKPLFLTGKSCFVTFYEFVRGSGSANPTRHRPCILKPSW